MEKEDLPRYSPVDELPAYRTRRQHRRRLIRIVIISLLGYLAYTHVVTSTSRRPSSLLSTERLQAEYHTCTKLRSTPQDPSAARERNGRYIEGHSAVLIKNASVWTGEPAPGTSAEDAHAGIGYAWVPSDVFLRNGLIQRVAPAIDVSELTANYTVYNAQGRPLTAGIIDMHSHTGVDSLPGLVGGEDTNELSNDITPYVRSIDGLNPLDNQLQVIKSGGVTTSLVLPGSGNNMGGEAYVIKMAVGRPDGREEISADDMLADPDHTWRYMKMACGENAKRVYGRLGRDFGPFSRLGEAWYFRHAFEQATSLVKAQDDWCAAADQVGAENMDSYLPLDLQWESLTALLRGQVLLNTHCYTVPDLEAFVRHTNEFKFKVRAFHHAHQTYLVPEILKRAYGDRPPAAALFADNMYYKAESYVASEKAGKILYENGITPVYVSDNPVLNAQHVVFEAAKACRNGLPYHAALAGVTTASAELLGMGHRIGKVKPGFDADIVVWDSDPLSVGATPQQVWIDGTPQYEDPIELPKAVSTPLVDQAALSDDHDAIKDMHSVIFTGVSRLMLSDLSTKFDDNNGNIVVDNSKVICAGNCEIEITTAKANNVPVIDLQNGHLAPPFTSFGSSLGLVEIQGESDTQDGDNGENTFSAAIDGLSLDTKNLRAAYAHGVTRAITAPSFQNGGHKGISVGFRTGAPHSLSPHAIFRSEVALHYTLTLAAKQGKTPSLSSAVGALRDKLLKAANTNTSSPAETKDLSTEETELLQVVSGTLPLVLTVHSADIIASILHLKSDVEEAILSTHHSSSSTAPPPKLNIILLGAAESHLLAHELAKANIPVVLAPLLAYSTTWDQWRSLTGAPLTNGTAVDVLHAAGVKVAISTAEDWEARDLGLLAGIAHRNSGGKISEEEALGMVGGNVYEMLGLKGQDERGEVGRREWVVWEGNPLETRSRVRAVADGRGPVSVWV